MDKPSGTLAVHRLPLYNPTRLNDAEIIAAYSARKTLLERIIVDIDAEKPTSRAQHHMIVGQRGMGKTLLLARIAAELRSGPLAARFIPITFTEEQYGVDRLSKFWLNCIDSLADEQDRVGAQTTVRKIDDIMREFSSQLSGAGRDDHVLAREVLEVFLEIADATERRPVLLVDNLQIVFERLNNEEQHSLREVLMRPGCPILIGATPGLLPESQDYAAAFYDHFKVHYLRPLELEEMRSVMLHLASVAARDDVRQQIINHPERLTILRQLTGGNPRTTITLFFLYAEDFAPNVVSDLENLLDRVTPIYKAIFEELSPQQQVLASAIANHWNPVTSRVLAGSTGLALNQISPQLDRLEKLGFIEKVDLFDTASIGYQIAERFLNVWFLMRSASRRQRRQVEFLTRFLQTVYEAAERNLLAYHLINEDDFSSDRYLFSCAVADSLESSETKEELKRHVQLNILRQQQREARRRIAHILEISALPPATMTFDQLRRKLAALIPTDAVIIPEHFAERILGDRQMFRDGERERLASRPEQLSTETVTEILDIVKESREIDEQTYSEDAVTWFSNRLIKGQLRSAKDIEDWDRAFQAANTRKTTQLMVDTLPAGIGGRIAVQTFDHIRSLLVPVETDSPQSWFNWAFNLHMQLERYEEAEAAYREAIARDPKDARPWIGLGRLYKNHMQRYEEAEAAYREATVRDPKDAISWNGLGNLFCDQLQRFDEAIAAYNKAIELDPMYEAIHQNLIFLHRDYLGEGVAAQSLMNGLNALPKLEGTDVLLLHKTLFSAYDNNWGLATASLISALQIIGDGFPPITIIDWMRASAVLLHLNYGDELMNLLNHRGDDVRLRPWYEALKALNQGDRRYLQNIAPEIRTASEKLYDLMERILIVLPDSTRRREHAALSKRTKREKSAKY